MISQLNGFLGRRHQAIAAATALLLVLAGAAYSVVLGDALRYLPDERDYVTLAERLESGGGYSLDGQHPSAYRAPGYPFLLAALRALGAGVVGYRLLNFVLLALMVWVVHAILLEQASPQAAALGPLLAAAYPLFFYTAGTLYPQILAALLFATVLHLFTRREGRLPHFLLGGLLLGWLILAVPTFAFLLGVFPLWFVFHRVRPAGPLLALAAAVLLVGVWTARNYTAFGRLVFVSSNSGENLLLGNSEDTRPNAGTNVDISRYQAQAAGLDEAGEDAFYRDQALAYLRAHPLASGRMYLLKVLNYFNIRNELVTRAEGSPLRDLLLLATYGPLLGLLTTRLLLARRRPLSDFEWLLAGVYLLSALVTAVFFTRIRFRLPFDLLLVLLAAMLVGSFFQGRDGGRSKRPVG